MRWTGSTLIAWVGVWGWAVAALAADDPAAAIEFFEKRVRPVLVEQCYACHSDREGKSKGDLRLDVRAAILKGGASGRPAIVPGDPDRSLLITAVRWKDDDLRMPPKRKLPDAVIADLEAWVKMGAPDPRAGGDGGDAGAAVAAKADPRDHWAFRPVRKPEPPAVKDANWPLNDVDRFILAALEARGLTPAPEADRRTLIRRLSYDLTGLPPTHAEVEAFAADASPDAYEKLVDRLLASPRYGERWGRHWLDLARYSDTKGYVYDREEKRFVGAHTYRDWVIRAFNEDLPYDRFLTLQIAADHVVGAEGIEQGHEDLAAMGFLTVGRRFLGIPHDIIDDRIDVVTRTTQGLTVACARCHDHKFDPVPSRDYYSLYGIFAGSMERTVPLGPEPARTDAYFAYEKELRKRTAAYESTMRKHREAVAERLRSQVWRYFQDLPGAEKLNDELFYETIFDDSVNPVVVRQWHAYVLRAKERFDPIFTFWMRLAELPADRFEAESSRVIDEVTRGSPGRVNAKVARALATTRPASMKQVAETYGALFDAAYKAGKARGGAPLDDPDEEALRAVLYAPDSPAQVPPGTYADVEHFFDEKARVEIGRAQGEVDRWNITAPAARPHALILVDRPVQPTARVFRRGNPSLKGEEAPRWYLELLSGPERKPFTRGSGRLELARAITDPANPLTARVMVNRVWAWHFGTGLVPTPSDFGLRTGPPSHPELLDHLAAAFVEDGWSIKRLHRRILLSRTYRQSGADNAAAVMADPDDRLLWRFPPRRLDFESMRDSLLLASGELDLRMGGRPEEMFKPPYSKRRTVYGLVDRQFVPGAMKAFDFANPDLHSPQRFETSVPQQSLFFLNGPFVVERARALAKRVARDEADPAARVRALYRTLYQRDPTERQLSAGLAFVAAAAADPLPPRPPPVEKAWQYGYGQFDEATQKLKSFKRLPHFTGKAWQGGPQWPDDKLGWAQLTAEGGHAGNDLAHAVVRRWVAPRDLTVKVSGTLAHARADGDGIRGRIVHSAAGQLAMWTLHDQSASTDVGPIALRAGESLDFVVDIRGNLNNDDFAWAPTITAVGDTVGDSRDQADVKKVWSAARDFGGAPTDVVEPLDPWAQYAQVLLSANEFMFVD